MRGNGVRGIVGILCVVLVFMASVQSDAGDRSLTYEERLAAQEAIERVFYQHRIWPKENSGPKPPFEKMMPPRVIEKKVAEYLTKSVLLNEYWQRPLTGEQLQAEMDRIANQTKDPQQLRELFAALNNDPFLIAECLARPVLADRLITSWLSHDERFQAEIRANMESLRARATAENFAELKTGNHTRIDIGLEAENSYAHSPFRQVSSSEFTTHTAAFPVREGKISTEETTDAFLLRLTHFRTGEEFHGEVRTFSKITVEDLLAQRIAVTEIDIPPLAQLYRLPKVLNGIGVPGDWANEPYVPAGRMGHFSAWTGSEMIVWGGTIPCNGGLYNPVTDSWRSMSQIDAPPDYTTAVWSGSEMILWGGNDNETITGARYNPNTDTWVALSTVGAPAPRWECSVVWTGNEMIIWGGENNDGELMSGGRYNPASNTWSGTTETGAPLPRRFPGAVVIGTEMLIWGGYSGEGTDTRVGGRYNFVTNSWSAMTTTNAPSARPFPKSSLVSTGTKMIVWGGVDSDSSGAIYNPAANTWTTLSTTGALSARGYHSAIWTGSEMIIWGGNLSTTVYNDGRRYNSETNTWTPLTTVNAPQARTQHSAIWIGTEMIVWGGSGLASGGRYRPADNSWTPTAITSGPAGRSKHTAVWTGTEMIVWGGGESWNTGGRYVPATDSWTLTPTTGAPAGRTNHSAVWSGSLMIVWGGKNTIELNSGGCYNPTTNGWTLTSTGTNVPSARYDHTAVWSGTTGAMIVWAGDKFVSSVHTYYNDGGRYYPGSNSWATISVVNAPAPRARPQAQWTGSDMLVWGGQDATIDYNNGGRYNPSTNSWVGLDNTGSPTGRSGPISIKTDTDMLVWGGWEGRASGHEINTGGSYDYFLNIWQALPTTGAPTPRTNHTGIWTGTEMLIWGGSSLLDANLGTYEYYNTGGGYHPGTGIWTDLSSDHAPAPRDLHTAIWTGNEMVVWGGYPNSQLGTYYPSTPPRSITDSALSAALLMHLNDPPGATEILDGSGGGNHGVCSGSECPTTGVIGKVRLAATFDGTTDQIRVPASDSLDTKDNITLLAWIKPTGVGSRPIIEYNDGSAFGVHLWQYPTFDCLFVNFIDTNGSYHMLTGPSLQFYANYWYHVAATYDGTNGCLYVNGVRVAYANLGPFTLRTDYDLYIGHRANTNSRFTGTIDEVAVYARALSDWEIRNRYLLDMAVLHLHLDDPDPTTIFQDSSAWGNHPTCQGDECPSAVSDGLLLGARSFDGTDDYLMTPHRPELDFDDRESFTVMAWVRTTVGSQGTNAKIVSKRAISGYTGDNYTLQLRYNAYGGIEVYSQDSGWVQAYGGLDLRDGWWHHVVGIVDTSEETVFAYVDGELVDSKPFVGSVANYADVMIGRIWDGSTDESFNGEIDEVIIFNRALTPAEVLFLYESPPENVTFVLGQSEVLNLDGTRSTSGSNATMARPDYDAFDSWSSSWDLHDQANCSGNFDRFTPGVSLDRAGLQSYDLAIPGIHRVWHQTTDLTGQTDCAPLVFNVRDGSPPTVAVITPNGGESWSYSPDTMNRKAHLIVWQSADDFQIARTRLFYSTSETTPYTCIADSCLDCPYSCGNNQNYSGSDILEPTDQSFWWEMPTQTEANAAGQTFPSATARILVQVWDESSNIKNDISDNYFYIIQPTSTAINTLIVWHSGRIEDQFGTAERDTLMLKLAEFVDHRRISGVVLDLANAGIDYSVWDGSPSSVPAANDVAEAIRDYLISQVTGTYTNAQYIILVGDDRIIPLHRMIDGVSIHTEHEYAGQVDPQTAVGAAIDQGYFLTDNYYSELTPEPSQLPSNPFLYMNDLAIGRLVETPAEMRAVINAFLAWDGQVNFHGTGGTMLVSGYDFLYDSAVAIRSLYQAKGKTVSCLLDDPDREETVDWCDDRPFSGSDLGAALFGATLHRVVNLNTHASHYQFGTSSGSPDYLSTVAMDSQDGLAGTTMYVAGCHSGLAVSTAPNELDLPQEMARKEVLAYIGNTGYGWGMRSGRGLTESLMELIGEELLAQDSITMGKALSTAKRKYFLREKRYDAFDEKVIHQLTLYGIPNTLIVSNLTKSDESGTGHSGLPAPSDPVDQACSDGVCLSKRLIQSGSGKAVPSGVIELNLNFTFSETIYQKVTTENGAYVTLNGKSSGEIGDALQPNFVYDSTMSDTNAHGVLFLAGSYREFPDFGTTVVVGTPKTTDVAFTPGPSPFARTWTPVMSVTYGTSDSSQKSGKGIGETGSVSMIVHTGEWDVNATKELVFDTMNLVVYYHQSTAAIGPVITDPGDDGFHTITGLTAHFAVPVSDSDGVWRVLITADDRLSRTWSTIDLSDGDGDGIWTGSLILQGTTNYYVQAVDMLGNVTVLSDSGPDLDGALIPYGTNWQGPLTWTINLDDGDPDYDYLTNYQEYVLTSDPSIADSDGGGDNDGSEVAHGRDPLDPDDDLDLTITLTKDGTSVLVSWPDGAGDNSQIDGYYHVYRSSSPFFGPDHKISGSPLPTETKELLDTSPLSGLTFYRVQNWPWTTWPPFPAAIVPTTGPASGGVGVTIYGEHFVIDAAVTFCGITALNTVVVNDGKITCTTPAHAAGSCDISVINPDGRRGTITNGFMYQ